MGNIAAKPRLMLSSQLAGVHCTFCYALATHPPSFNTRVVDAGLFLSAFKGRIGRGENLPEQFGQI
jgi:DNA repair photolyase